MGPYIKRKNSEAASGLFLSVVSFSRAMATVTECWSGRPSTDEDMAEQVLMNGDLRSEAYSSPDPVSAAVPPKRRHRLSRNLAGAIAALKSSLNLENSRDPSEKASAEIRRHFESLPASYAQAEIEMKEVALHRRLIEQAATEDHPVVNVQVLPQESLCGTLFKLTFASHSPISWSAIADSLDASAMVCKKIQLFEKRGLTLGIALLLVQSASEKLFKMKAEAALRSAVKKPAPRSNGGIVKLPFSLCGCRNQEAEIASSDWRRNDRVSPSSPLSSFVVSIDELQALKSGAGEIQKWLISPEELEISGRISPNCFSGVYRGKSSWIQKLRGCEKGTAYEIELRRNLLELMSCNHPNILHLHGLYIDQIHGLCLVTESMEQGSLHDLIQKIRKIPAGSLLSIAGGIAEGLKFINDHGISYRDLNTRSILLDNQGKACLGDLGAVSVSKTTGEVADYETSGYQWLAPEIISGDPETVTETWMSNVYSFGMVLWEMVTGEAAYSRYSPVQAAVGIAACGLRPEIPGDCPPVLRSLMIRCWNSSPSRRPPFSEISAILASGMAR